MKTYQGLGYELDEERAEQIIKSVDKDGDMNIDMDEFMALMKPEMEKRLFEHDEGIEQFRAIFRDADIDYSGHLSADEVYSCLLSNGIDLSFDELCELISEFDVDSDGKLSIDEFVAMMNTDEDVKFGQANAKNAYLKIRKAARLNVTDVLKAL